jgi:hypothetical protein
MVIPFYELLVTELMSYFVRPETFSSILLTIASSQTGLKYSKKLRVIVHLAWTHILKSNPYRP